DDPRAAELGSQLLRAHLAHVALAADPVSPAPSSRCALEHSRPRDERARSHARQQGSGPAAPRVLVAPNARPRLVGSRVLRAHGGGHGERGGAPAEPLARRSGARRPRPMTRLGPAFGADRPVYTGPVARYDSW